MRKIGISKMAYKLLYLCWFSLYSRLATTEALALPQVVSAEKVAVKRWTTEFLFRVDAEWTFL